MGFSYSDLVAAAGVPDPRETFTLLSSGDPGAIRAMATGFGAAADAARTAMAAASRADSATAAHYAVNGQAVYDAPAATASTRKALADGGEHMTGVAKLLTVAADELTGAQTAVQVEMKALEADLAALATASNTLAGNSVSMPPAAAAAAERALFEQGKAIVRQRGTAIKAQADGYNELLHGLAGQLSRYGRNDRDPDGRNGRRIQRDEFERRPPGGDGRTDRVGGNIDNDWAGRAILERYLEGGENWTITNDPSWTEYMRGNQALRNQLLEPVQVEAQHALDEYLRNGTTTVPHDRRFHMEVENGEGITGYQYLHGTNADVGDFQMQGNSKVRPLADGTYEVTLDSSYTWNDVIDPNGTYRTDRVKSTIAEILTLGRADPYDLHITYPGSAKVVMDGQGNVLDVSGYPGR